MASFFPTKGASFPLWKTLIGLSLLAPLLASAEAPKAFSYQYGFTGAGIPFSISATRSLRAIGDNQWQTELSAKNFLGSIRETSTFHWQGCVPITTHYEYKRKGLGQSRSAQLTLAQDRKSTRLNSSHVAISYAVFCLKKRSTPTPASTARPRAARW